MDAVYILGTGSLVADEEIRYSIRSLQENMLDLREVWVVGAYPASVPSVRHIEAPDEHIDAWKNTWLKTRLACQQEEISDTFLLMNDDFFMTTPFEGADFPFYARKGMDGGQNGPHAFTPHCPITIEKELYLKLPLDLSMKGHVSPRSFYANFTGRRPTMIDDFVLRAGTRMPPFDAQIKGRDFFTISNGHMLFPEFREWLAALYPTPSRFETPTAL